jgi:hypothetical protein
LEDNNMAYKFQLGAARLSGSVIQTDGDGDLRATTVDSLNASNGGITAAGAIAGATTISGSSNLRMGGTLTAANGAFIVASDGAVTAVGVDAGGAISGATTIAASALANLDGGIELDNGGNKFTVSTAGVVVAAGKVTADEFATDGNEFSVSTAGAVVAVGVNAGGAISGATTIAGSGLASLGSIAVDDGSTIGTDSDADMLTLTNADNITVASDVFFVVTKDKLKIGATAVTSTAAELNLLDTAAVGTVVNSKAVIYSAAGQVNSTTLSASSNVSAGGSFYGAGIALASAEGIAGTGIDNNGGSLQPAATQTLIATMTNAALVVGRDTDNKIDFGTEDNNVIFTVNGAERLRLNALGNTIVKGDLLVEGETTTIDSTTINVSRSFTFEGPVSDFQTIFGYGATDAPLQDITVLLPEYSSSAGAHNVKAAVIAAGDSAANYAASALVTAAEFALLDGATAATSPSGGLIVDADRMILNDNGTMRQIAMSDVKTYAGGAAQVLSVIEVENADDLVIDKVNYVLDRDGSGQNVGLTLPASAAGLIGKSIYLKAGNLENSATITVATQASAQKIDGADSIILESPYASVRLIYVTTNQWRVF